MQTMQITFTRSKTGITQYNLYLRECLEECTKPVSDTIHKNNLVLYGATVEKEKSKAQRDVTSLKNNCHLFSRLFIA